MATVLLVIDSPTIEALTAELVMYAGYQPVVPRGDESAVDAMRRRCVDAVIVDVEIAPALIDACEKVAREISAAVVYIASGNRPGELRALAESHKAAYFALPNGPKLLARVLAEALVRSGRQPVDAGTLPSYELIMALRGLRDQTPVLFDDAKSKRELLHVAAVDYLRDLRGDGVSRQRAMELVTTAMRESAEATGAPDLFAGVEHDAVRWVEEAYHAA